MKKYSILSIGILFLMLIVGGIAFGEGGMGGSSDQSSGSSMGTSSDQGGMGQSGTSGMGAPSEQSGTSGTSSMAQGQVDINTASAKELESVPGMTKSMARNIVKYRDQNGPFSSVDDLTKVKGVSEQKLGEMRSSLTVGQAGGGAAPSSGAQQGTSGMESESGGAGGTGGMDSGAGSESGGTGGMGTDSSGSSGTSGTGSSSGSSGY